MVRAADLSLDEQIALLSGGSFWWTTAVPDHGVPAVLLSDGPHGLRVQPEGGEHLGLDASLPATCFPTAAALACSWDEALVQRVGDALGVEARAAGVALVLGPGMNIKRHPLCGRNFEYFSEDPLLTGRLAAAMVRGIQARGVGACVKHFAVNNQESHRFVVDAVVDERTLRELYLSAFEHVITRERPWAVMAAYNGVNGTPCTDNRHLLSTVLRDEWGFDGLVVSDWGAVNDRVAAVAAGTDLEMPGGHGVFDREVRAALDEGRLPADSVRACADRVLDLVARAPGEPGPPAPLDDHDGLARAAAAACTVLLTNDGTLPLSAGATVALIGTFAHEPRYQGTGSSRVNPTRLTTAAEEFSRRGLAVRHAPGYDPDGTVSPQLRADAVAAAAACDVAVVMVGLPHVAESEGFDREHLRLPDSHDALVEAVCAANPRTVVAVSNGAPVLMPWAAAPAAILECYLGGQAGGAALVDVLCGDAEPGGRLAETFPVRQEDVAADPYFPGQSHQVQYREGLAVGYRHAVTSGVEPLFPFGHGLGYSTFEFGPAEVGAEAVRAGDPVRVTVPVTNTGDRAGSTVVQVYLHDRTGRVARPRRWLAGFAKVHLDPGETALTRIDVESRAFAVFDTGTWRIPAGEYALEMGTSSADILQTVEVTVIGGSTGGDGPAPLVAAGDEQFARRLGRGIPAPRPVRPYSRMSTIGQIAGNPVGRLVRGLSLRVGGYYGEPDPAVARMILRSVDELPLRSVAMLSEGRVGMDMIDALVHVVNGRPDRALTWAARRGAAGLARRLRSRGLPRG